MRRSTLIAIVLSWASFTVAAFLAIRRASNTPHVDPTRLVFAIAAGTLGLALLHSWVRTETVGNRITLLACAALP